MNHGRTGVPCRHSSFYRTEQLAARASDITTPAPGRLLSGLVLAALLLCGFATPAASARAAAANSPGDPGCAAGDGLHYICGPRASEDLVRVPDSRWLIASGMNVGTPGHLYLVDARDKRAAVAFPPEASGSQAPAASTMGCSGPPDPARMSLDGLALRPGAHGRHTLYAANHGDRMAVEVFSVDAAGSRPKLRWIDCARLPANTLPNAVATLADGGFLVISFYDPTDPLAWARMGRAEMTGRILRWLPGHGFAPLPDGATSGGNGLETSADGGTVYASSWSARRLVVLSLRDGSRRELPLDFMPDNIHRLADGSLLVGGQRTTVAAIRACSGPQCPQPWVIARLEPGSGRVQELASGAGTTAVNYACGAVAVAGTLFITVRGADRIAWRRLSGPALQDLH